MKYNCFPPSHVLPPTVRKMSVLLYDRNECGFCPQAFDDCIFAFFAVEMVIKMIALGIFGSKCYLGDTWNRLDFFIVMAG